MEEVAAPVSLHHPMARKRHPHWLVLSQPQPPKADWNPSMWEWDSQRFQAKPVDDDGAEEANNVHASSHQGGGEGRGLDLNLSSTPPPIITMPNKRVKSGSPGSGGGGNYPKCQVDNCMEDLSVAKCQET